ncbi:MAG: TetR/AcrR family transcriptional regulator [Phycisphaerales bacterium]|nr:TetR/AcrR family transcriptional regulator [Phycisphaerales bacterium]
MTDSETRSRLIEAAYALMLSNGYSATGVADICSAAGVSKGSFYHCFETKEQCALAALRDHMSRAREQVEAGLDLTGLSPAQAAVKYVEHIEKGAEDIWCDGCLVGAFALEISETQPAIREEVSQVLRDLADYMESIFAPLAKAVRGPGSPSARELAEQYIAVIEGGVVLSRAHSDIRMVPQALRTFRRYLSLLLTHSN